VAYPVLRHRILTNFNAEAEGISSDDIIKRLIESIPTTSSDSLEDPRMPKVMEA
jgi:MoxR-like ATPase